MNNVTTAQLIANRDFRGLATLVATGEELQAAVLLRLRPEDIQVFRECLKEARDEVLAEKLNIRPL